MNFAKPKPTPIAIPLWSADTITKQVRKFRTENSRQFFSAMAHAGNEFHVERVSVGKNNAEWMFDVRYEN